MNGLSDPNVAACLARLHEAAARDSARRRSSWRRGADDDVLIRMGDFYLAVSPAEGRLLYVLARGGRAASIVEFGASFGVSTIYLAAAARDNGGHVVTTEVHPDKCAALRESFARAGVEDCVTLLEGDARETLAGVEGPVDLLFLDGWKSMYLRGTIAEAGLADVVTVLEGDARETLVDVEAGVDFAFLDGWKSMYLPVLQILVPKLRAGALVAADNVDHDAARPYAEHVRSSPAFVSHTLGKMELSCYTPD